MGGFTPFKRHANQFKYTPRYYDPSKEAREQRRAELRGERLDDSAEEEYEPGKYIRRSSAARAARIGVERNPSKKLMKTNTWIMIAIVAAIAWMGTALYTKLMEMFVDDGRAPRTEVVEETFDSYAPITIVPNDYEE